MTDLADLIPGQVYDRSDIGMPSTPGGSQRDRSLVRAMTGHHTTGRTLGDRSHLRWVKNIYDYHVHNNGWADIGYAYLYDVQGNVFVGRGRYRSLAHASGYNTTHLGVAFLGTGNATQMTVEAKLAFWGLRKWLREDGGMNNMHGLNGHRDLGSTSCPGAHKYAWIADGAPRPGEEPDMSLSRSEIEAIAEDAAEQKIADLFLLDKPSDAQYLTERHREVTRGVTEMNSDARNATRYALAIIREAQARGWNVDLDKFRENKNYTEDDIAD